MTTTTDQSTTEGYVTVSAWPYGGQPELLPVGTSNDPQYVVRFGRVSVFFDNLDDVTRFSDTLSALVTDACFAEMSPAKTGCLTDDREG